MAASSSSSSFLSPSSSSSSLQKTSLLSRSLNLGFCNADAPKILIVRCNSGSGTPPLTSDASGSKKSPPLTSSSSSAIDFLTLCHRLKTTKRKGWINHGIKGPESIADHMYRMALMALITADLSGVNRERCIKIAIVHDIAEAIVGDITPSDGVPKAEKSRLEQEALNEMCEVLGGGLRAEEIQELWAEYENNSSIEANLVKDFDKVEMILQALEYETEFDFGAKDQCKIGAEDWTRVTIETSDQYNMGRYWMNFSCPRQASFRLKLGRVGQLR